MSTYPHSILHLNVSTIPENILTIIMIILEAVCIIGAIVINIPYVLEERAELYYIQEYLIIQITLKLHLLISYTHYLLQAPETKQLVLKLKQGFKRMIFRRFLGKAICTACLRKSKPREILCTPMNSVFKKDRMYIYIYTCYTCHNFKLYLAKTGFIW